MSEEKPAQTEEPTKVEQLQGDTPNQESSPATPQQAIPEQWQEPQQPQEQQQETQNVETEEVYNIQIIEQQTPESQEGQSVEKPKTIRDLLEEIKAQENVIGYAIRNGATNIDLKDPTKLLEFAILSSASIDAGEELSTLFNVGQIKHITVIGKNVKIVSLILDGNKISLFLERNTNPEEIIEKLQSFKP